jgi:hypothetical protein
MQYFERVFVSVIALPGLAALGVCWMPAIVHANPLSSNQQFVMAKLLPKLTTYDCGTVGGIALTRDSKNRDRFTYDAVNSRGQTLTVKNGVGYGDAKSTIYTFVAKDGAEFIIEEFPTGKATLTTSGKGGVNSTSFDCTVIKATRAAASESTASSSSSESSGSSSRASSTRTTVIRETTEPKPTSQTGTGAVRALW